MLEAISPGEEYFATTPKKVNLSLPSQTNQTILFGFAIKQSETNDISLGDAITITPSSPLILAPKFEVELNINYTQVGSFKIEEIKFYSEENLLKKIEADKITSNSFKSKIIFNPSFPQQIKTKILVNFTDNTGQHKTIQKFIDLIKL